MATGMMPSRSRLSFDPPGADAGVQSCVVIGSPPTRPIRRRVSAGTPPSARLDDGPCTVPGSWRVPSPRARRTCQQVPPRLLRERQPRTGAAVRDGRRWHRSRSVTAHRPGSADHRRSRGPGRATRRAERRRASTVRPVCGSCGCAAPLGLPVVRSDGDGVRPSHSHTGSRRARPAAASGTSRRPGYGAASVPVARRYAACPAMALTLRPGNPVLTPSSAVRLTSLRRDSRGGTASTPRGRRRTSRPCPCWLHPCLASRARRHCAYLTLGDLRARVALCRPTGLLTA